MMRKLLLCLSLLPFAPLLSAPITASPGIGLGQGEFFAAFGTNHKEFESPNFPRFKESRFVDEEALLLAYGLSRNLFMFGAFPFSQKEAQLDHKTIHKTSGAGDLILGATYAAYVKNTVGRTIRLLLSAGAQAPTGRFNEKDLLGPIPRPLQPGKGNWAMPLQAYYTFQTLEHEFFALLLFTPFAKGHGYQFGNSLTWVLSWNMRMFPWVAPEKGYYSELLLTTELDGVWLGQNRANGKSLPDTGGHTITFQPGLRYNHKFFSVALAYIHPVCTQNNRAGGKSPPQLELKPWRSWVAEIAFRY